MFERIRDGIVNFITSRTSVLTIHFLVMAGVLIQRIFELQIVNGETYQNEFSLQIRKERSIPSARGNIYDRNGKLLAYNDLAYSVTIEDVYENTNKNANMNATLLEVFRILEENGDEVVSASAAPGCCVSWRTCTATLPSIRWSRGSGIPHRRI